MKTFSSADRGSGTSYRIQAGDVNGDDHPDVVCGPYWWAGPDFKTRNEISPPKAFPNDRGY